MNFHKKYTNAGDIHFFIFVIKDFYYSEKTFYYQAKLSCFLTKTIIYMDSFGQIKKLI